MQAGTATYLRSVVRQGRGRASERLCRVVQLMEALVGGAEAVTTVAETGVAGTAGSVATETGAAGAGIEASKAVLDG